MVILNCDTKDEILKTVRRLFTDGVTGKTSFKSFGKMIAMNDPAKGNTKTAADASERLRGTSHPTFLGGSEYLQQKITFARDILAR